MTKICLVTTNGFFHNPFFFFFLFWAIAKNYSYLSNRVYNVEVRAYKFEIF